MEKWRVCSKCKIFKVWDLFSKDKNKKLWYTSNCKECRNKYKEIYKNTLEWKRKIKNYMIILRADPEYRKQQKEKYKIWELQNKDKTRECQKRYWNKNKKLINQRRKDMEDFNFSVWRKVIFENQVWKVLDVKFKMWCLVLFENWFKMWIWKYKLKPFKKVQPMLYPKT